MSEITQWEYRVGTVGTTWTMPKDEDIEKLLDEWGEQGWEVFSVFTQYGSNKVRVVARWPLTSLGSPRQKGSLPW